MAGPSITHTPGTLYEENLSIALLNPALRKEVCQCLLRGIDLPISIRGIFSECDRICIVRANSNDESNRGSFMAVGRIGHVWVWISLDGLNTLR